MCRRDLRTTRAPNRQSAPVHPGTLVAGAAGAERRGDDGDRSNPPAIMHCLSISTPRLSPWREASFSATSLGPKSIVLPNQGQNSAPECLAILAAATFAGNQGRCAIGTKGSTQSENLAPAQTHQRRSTSTVIRPSARSIVMRSRVSS
jgi:hypothetical protein